MPNGICDHENNAVHPPYPAASHKACSNEGNRVRDTMETQERLAPASADSCREAQAVRCSVPMALPTRPEFDLVWEGIGDIYIKGIEVTLEACQDMECTVK